MHDIFEHDVAVDGPVVNEGERSSSTVSTGQGPRVGSLERGQRWTVRRKHEAVLRLLGGAPVELLSRELGIEMNILPFDKQIAAIAALTERMYPVWVVGAMADPVSLDTELS